jgi:phospholipase/lecithinase/hemolysin
VGLVSAYGGGQFTINAASSVKAVTPTNWTEYAALSLGLAMPCAAQTGLDIGLGAVSGVTYVPVDSNHPGCTNYAQGGSRVTDPAGMGNKNSLVQPGFALTVPVATQIQNFLTAHGGSFSGKELVTVMAGANDVLTQFGLAKGGLSPASAVVAVNTAANDLVATVNTEILGKGAKYVTGVNIPDVASTPFGATYLLYKDFINSMVATFNTTLQNGLANNPNVLFVDAFTASQDEVTNRAKYNLTNATGTACKLNYPDNILAASGVPNSGSSLVCNAGNLNSGVSATDHYLFADTVHPTPYAHLLFATYVLQQMTNKGWY